MQKKQFYEAPEAEALSVKFEKNFCDTDGNGLGDGNEVTPFGTPSRTRSNPNDYSNDYRTY